MCSIVNIQYTIVGFSVPVSYKVKWRKGQNKIFKNVIIRFVTIEQTVHCN